MHHYVLAKIKNQDRFKQVFPLPFNGDNNLARFIRSILGQNVRVRKAKGQVGRFHYVSDLNPRWIIMPSWIEYFDTEELVPACSDQENSIGLVVYRDGTVVVLGS